MLEHDDAVDSTTLASPEPDPAPDAPAAPRGRPRRSASRPAGPPPTVANPFLVSPPEAEPAVEEVAEEPEAPVAPPARPAAVALFQVPQIVATAPAAGDQLDASEEPGDDTDADAADADRAAEDGEQQRAARRRRSRNRRRGGQRDGGQRDGGGPAEAAPSDGADSAAEPAPAAQEDQGGAAEDQADGESAEAGEPGTSTKRRRRRRRGGEGDSDEPKARGGDSDKPEKATAVKGSTRLEAKKQRRREGREAGRRRAPILSEAEFLARREAVDRSMLMRQRDEITQIAVLEDGVLVEHYVTKDEKSSATMVGNVYLGRVQNVLPSMEAAFVDIGRGRNAVLYAGEVNWDAAGLEGQPKRIEFALKSGDAVLVQVTKDPIGHKGARLTSQVSLPGRYLVYVPQGSMTGISRKLPDTERARLRGILKRIVPDGVGVIVRTAAEGASEEELTRDVERLSKTWSDIQRKAKSSSPTQLLHSEPDLAIRVVRDIFNEDFTAMAVAGDRSYERVKQYVDAVAPDLAPRVSKWTGTQDAFVAHRVDEQLAKALDRKVWLPSGGSLIIEHTEAMTVIDVNTGRFTGQGGDLEETVTQNNLEAAEEIVRQVRLRDIGGIVVIDFIDMVLENNRDLVLRRLVECLGRDRTKHQVTEVTSLGLVQMTRKRIGAGLLETFSEPCDCCNGRGVRITLEPGGAPASGRRKPVKPSGAHDPVEAMKAREVVEPEAEEAQAPETDDATDERAAAVDGAEESFEDEFDDAREATGVALVVDEVEFAAAGPDDAEDDEDEDSEDDDVEDDESDDDDAEDDESDDDDSDDEPDPAAV
jgi:ribonuclease E